MSIYSKVSIRKPGRNVFYLNHSYRGFLNIGELKPIARPIECVPGDTFITGNISKIELSPIVTNFFGELYFETWQFFVSNDSLYNSSNDSGKFTQILASLQNPQSILPLPYFPLTSIIASDKSNLYNYIYGDLLTSSISSNKHLIAYPIRAVWKIWDEWFRDENLQTTLAFNNGPTMLYVNYKKDRFTSAFISTQKGTELRFRPLFSQTAMKLFEGDSSYISRYDEIAGTDGPTQLRAYFGSGSIGIAPFYVNPNKTSDEIARANANFAEMLNMSNIGISINDLRLYNKLQKWQERNQLCGTRIKEYLLSNYGVTPNDETLQRPVLIGHTKVPVVIDPILSNIQNDNLDPSSPSTLVEKMQNKQGSRGGIAGGSSSFKYGKWFCKEFGWIITLGALRPKASYSQGIHKSLRKDSVVDYFNPIFEHLGQQEIKMSEIYFQNNNDDDKVLGYQDIYNEMRHLEDFTAPDLANQYENKTMFRKFASEPTLAGLLPVKPSEYDYLFAYPHSTAPQATFTSLNVVKAIRPLSKRSTPSL